MSLSDINKSTYENFLLEIEKVVKTFSIPDKLFPKLVYYCVPLGHTLVKSKKETKSRNTEEIKVAEEKKEKKKKGILTLTSQ